MSKYILEQISNNEYRCCCWRTYPYYEVFTSRSEAEDAYLRIASDIENLISFGEKTTLYFDENDEVGDPEEFDFESFDKQIMSVVIDYPHGRTYTFTRISRYDESGITDCRVYRNSEEILCGTEFSNLQWKDIASKFGWEDGAWKDGSLSQKL